MYGALVIMPLSAAPAGRSTGVSRASLKASVKLAATPARKSPFQIAIFAIFATIG
jgi:hypothetical protein